MFEIGWFQMVNILKLTNRMKIDLWSKDRAILQQNTNMLYRTMVYQFLKMDFKRLHLFHKKDLSDISSALI